MAFQSFSVPVGPNKTFIADERVTGGQLPWPKRLNDNDTLKKYILNTYKSAYSSMAWQFARMRAIERFYSGLPYLLPNDNFENEITNHAFAVVETIWPELVGERPRPVIIPRSSASDVERTKKHNRLAQWCMDITGFDEARRKGMRAKLKFGWNTWLMVQNARTGLPIPKHWSNWCFLPDPSAGDAESLMYYILASPVNTNVIRAIFGDKANGLTADNYVSPGYRSLIENHREYWLLRDEGANDIPWTGTPVVEDTQPPPSGQAKFVLDSTQQLRNANTAYLLQFVFRDLSKMKVAYRGRFMHHQDGEEPITYEGFWTDDEYVCDSGWRVATCVPGHNTILQCEPLDAGWDGANIVMGHDYQHEDRLFGYGEIDMIMSKMRAIHTSDKQMNLALAFETNPVVVADKDNAIKFNQGTIRPGDTVFKKHGSTVEWLRYYGVNEHQFERQARRKADIQDISGVTPAQEGQRPAGIEAGVALKTLLSQALKRTMGKTPQYLDECAQVVKKQMVWLSQHLDDMLSFLANDGTPLSIQPSEFYGMFDVKFDERSASQHYREQQLDELLVLHQSQIVDTEYVIDQLDLPGGDALKMRMRQQQFIQMLLDAKAKAEGGPAKPGGGQKKGAAA